MVQNASDVVATRIRELRKARGLTVKGLADRCAELGAPTLTVASLTNAERPGADQSKARPRREVPIGELFVLAQALEVPPLALLVPDSDEAEQEVEVLPGVKLSPMEAWLWIVGLQPALPDASASDVRKWREGAAPMRRLFVHEHLVMAAREALRDLDAFPRDASDEDRDRAEARAWATVDRLMDARGDWADMGWPLPTLPDDLDQVMRMPIGERFPIRGGRLSKHFMRAQSDLAAVLDEPGGPEKLARLFEADRARMDAERPELERRQAAERAARLQADLGLSDA